MNEATKKSAMVVGLACALGACGGGGTSDGGVITFDDVGAPDVGMDDAGEPDAGDGTCGETISITGWGALPDTCLPRCTAATHAAVNACGSDLACINTAVLADTTPGVVVRTYAGLLGVSCGGEDVDGLRVYPCIAWQDYACQAEVCQPEYAAWATCVSAGTCTDEMDTLYACIETNIAAYQSCISEAVVACYATE